MSNLVLFTNRTGSTLLSDILAYNDRSVNLGEGLHSIARQYNYNPEENRQTELYKHFMQSSMTAQFHNQKTRGSDHIGFFKAKNARINILKNTDYQWTVKENLEKLTLDINFIDYCIENNINVYATHRYDVVSQFLSKINARYRLEIAKLTTNESQFIYTNQDSTPHYLEIKIPFTWLHMYVNVFIEQLLMWRVIYERYKNNIKLVSYEDVIRPMDFTSLGISKQTVDNYRKETKHLVPTPYNCERVVVVDDHPKPVVGAWDQALFYIQKHQYLVEV